MDDFTLARVLHVLAVLLWIGGVAFVTLIIMPAIAATNRGPERLAAFHKIEGPFSRQARLWVLLAGVSGLWMIWRGDLWSRFADLHFWWMHAMVVVWAVFAAMLFVLEPLVLHRRMAESPSPEGDFARMVTMHRVLLVASLVTLAGAVAGSRGF